MNERAKDRINKRLEMRHKWPKVPLSKEGDPAFETLDDLKRVFDEREIVMLANRALYALKYQREHHKMRYQARKEQEAQNGTECGEK